jgi:hypothetical protein
MSTWGLYVAVKALSTQMLRAVLAAAELLTGSPWPRQVRDETSLRSNTSLCGESSSCSAREGTQIKQLWQQAWVPWDFIWGGARKFVYQVMLGLCLLITLEYSG